MKVDKKFFEIDVTGESLLWALALVSDELGICKLAVKLILLSRLTLKELRHVCFVGSGFGFGFHSEFLMINAIFLAIK